MRVFISAHCRKARLFGSTTLVFDSIRTGFPTAEIIVFGSNLQIAQTHEVKKLCAKVGAKFYPMKAPLHHDEWIEKLLLTFNEPFWIVDTDVVFHESVEGWKFDAPLAGRFMRQFWDEWNKCFHYSRLMTCLMYMDPVALRKRTTDWMNQWPMFPGNPIFEFVRQHFAPVRGEDGRVTTFLYDTCAGLYQAFGGQSFTPEQNAAFDHLFAGSYADLLKLDNGVDMEACHRAIVAQPGLAKGIWLDQEQYLAHTAPTKG